MVDGIAGDAGFIRLSRAASSNQTLEKVRHVASFVRLLDENVSYRLHYINLGS